MAQLFARQNKKDEPAENRSGRQVMAGRIISVAATVILILAIGLCVSAVVQTRTQGYVNIAGRSFFRVVTGSMEPAIPQGALLMTRRTPIEDLRAGDVICFCSRAPESQGLVITHRIVAVFTGDSGDLMLETKGDANSVADGHMVTRENLIGKVVWFTGKGDGFSRFLAFVTEGIGFLALVAVPSFLLASALLVRSIRNVRGELEALSQALEQEKHKKEPVAPTISQEEMDALRAEVWQELMSQRREIMQELLQEIMQGEQHE